MSNYKICIVGLGNVGLDLAINFSKKFNTIGFDINKELIKKIKVHKKKHLNSSENPNNRLTVSYLEKLIIDCDIYIVTVPTPVGNNKTQTLIWLLKQLNLFLNFFLRII